METTNSRRLFKEAQALIPGGVNSPVRAFRSVGSTPVYITRAEGSRMWDVDGNEYIDYVGSWGPMILGHASTNVVEAVQRACESGLSFGASCELEIRMAELVCRMVSSMEMVRMVNSGTEATMSAIRLARAYTGREKIMKFAGCYHGHGDAFLIAAGSGAMTLSIPDSPGVPTAVAQDTLVAEYNHIESVQALLEQNRGKIAAVIIEPVPGNMGCLLPKGGFLQDVRRICSEHDVLLIFDEVMTGFRLAAGGAQEVYDITPDLTTLGKIIGGGLPVGAYGGRREIMEKVAPLGPMYQAGTLSGNPLALTAGLEVLSYLERNPDVYATLKKTTSALVEGMERINRERKLSATINNIGSMFTLFFHTNPVFDYASAKKADTRMFASYFKLMLEQGVYLPPSQFEAAFVSLAHSSSDVEQTLQAHATAVDQINLPRNR
jgi:glutamate-1-semialdehyde 2,1-aminomutase